MVDDEARKRGIGSVENAALPFHAVGQPGGDCLVGSSLKRTKQRTRVILGLEQARDDGWPPVAQAGRLVFVLWPRAEAGRHPRAAVLEVLAEPATTLGEDGVAYVRHRLGGRAPTVLDP